MSDLNMIEKTKLEKLFGMGSGYVLEHLGFTDRTFREFVIESTGKDIFDPKYQIFGGSKAKCLRGFWKEESNYLVGKLIYDLIKYSKEFSKDASLDDLHDECLRIAERLRQSIPVQEIDAITPNTDGRNFDILAKSVREAIEKNEPEAGLDRLHTFVVKYIRVLCEKHGISFDKNKPLHSLIGEYIKEIKQADLIESEMTERILKANISILESFSNVRNDKSLAHDNQMLNYDESLLIFNNVASLIRFLNALENRVGDKEKNENNSSVDDDDLPF